MSNYTVEVRRKPGSPPKTWERPVSKKPVTLAVENLFKKPEEPKGETLSERLARQRIRNDVTHLREAMERLGFTPEDMSKMADMLDGLSVQEIVELQLPPKSESKQKKGIKQKARRARRRVMKQEFSTRTAT